MDDAKARVRQALEDLATGQMTHEQALDFMFGGEYGEDAARVAVWDVALAIEDAARFAPAEIQTRLYDIVEQIGSAVDEWAKAK